MIVPSKMLIDNPEAYGFKKCKRPYNNCYYKCFARGCKMIFLSKYLVELIDWQSDDPRIHSRPNCQYRDFRTAEDFFCELAALGLVKPNYLVEYY